MWVARTQEGGAHRGPEPSSVGRRGQPGWVLQKNVAGGPSCKRGVFPDAPGPCLPLPVWVSPPGSSSCLITVLPGASTPQPPPERLSPVPLTPPPHRPFHRPPGLSAPPMTPRGPQLPCHSPLYAHHGAWSRPRQPVTQVPPPGTRPPHHSSSLTPFVLGDHGGGCQQGPPGKSVDANKPPSDTPQSQVHHHSSASTAHQGCEAGLDGPLSIRVSPWGLAPSPPRGALEPQCQPGSVTEAKARF